MLTLGEPVDTHLGVTKVPTETLKRFSAWVESVGGQTAAAKILKCSRSFTCLMEQGKRRPRMGTKLAERIEDKSTIPTADWFRKPPAADKRAARVRVSTVSTTT
jgi:hypothetical protein